MSRVPLVVFIKPDPDDPSRCGECGCCQNQVTKIFDWQHVHKELNRWGGRDTYFLRGPECLDAHKLLADLLHYAQHHQDCPCWDDGDGADEDCSCGLNSTLAAINEAKP